MIALTFCNIVGPLEAVMAGIEKVSGRAYCEANLKSWRAYAHDVRDHQGPTDADAIAYATEAYARRSALGPRFRPKLSGKPPSHSR